MLFSSLIKREFNPIFRLCFSSDNVSASCWSSFFSVEIWNKSLIVVNSDTAEFAASKITEDNRPFVWTDGVHNINIKRTKEVLLIFMFGWRHFTVSYRVILLLKLKFKKKTTYFTKKFIKMKPISSFNTEDRIRFITTKYSI